MTNVKFQRIIGTLLLWGGLLAMPVFGQDAASFSGDFSFSPSVLSSRTYFEGSETLGRVGNEPILKRDILHQMKKYAYLSFLDQREKAPESEKQHFSDKNFPIYRDQFLTVEKVYNQILDEHIRKLLFYNDYVVSRTKEELTEQTKNLEKVYNNEYMTHLLKQMKCENVDELKEVFTDKLDSSLEQEKRLFIQQTLGDSWLEFNLGAMTYHPTVVDLRRWYDAHPELFQVPDKVRWYRMSVLFSNHATREEAMQKIVYMGNAVREARSPSELLQRFTQVAKGDSEDYFASKGGECGWNGRNELNSRQVEEALFSEALPVNSPSRIIDDGAGYTILLVVERQLKHTRSFVEVQEEVREKMVEEHKESNKTKYENELAKRFAVEIYTITPEERRRQIEEARRTSESASGRERAY